MDHRLKENRREAFIRWYAWSLTYKDCDPAVWLANYLNKRYEHNREQRYWFAWLYGNTYNLPTAWVLMNEFPDFELATVDRMEKWNNENYKRLRYQVDTKWNKGHLPTMFASYKDWIGGNSQEDKFRSLFADDRQVYFENLWGSIKGELHKFGRYSTWFYIQQLKHTAGIDVDPTSLMLSDYSGSRSHRNGLLFALGMDSEIDRKLSPMVYDTLEREGLAILEETRARFPKVAHEADFFTMETCLCSFKKIFRERQGRYLGYYLDRQCEEIQKAEGDGWYGIDWNVVWQARNEMLDSRLDNRYGIDKERFGTFVNTGYMMREDWMFDDVEKIGFNLEDFAYG